MDACILRSRDDSEDKDCGVAVNNTNFLLDGLVPQHKDIYSAVIDHGLTNPDFKLYVLGYPHFFNVDTDQCDGATFTYYKDDDEGPFLTKDMRNTINGLIQKKMNDAIRAAVIAANDKHVVFVDISPFFTGHRFCELGIEKPYSGGIFTGIVDNAAR